MHERLKFPPTQLRTRDLDTKKNKRQPLTRQSAPKIGTLKRIYDRKPKMFGVHTICLGEEAKSMGFHEYFFAAIWLGALGLNGWKHASLRRGFPNQLRAPRRHGRGNSWRITSSMVLSSIHRGTTSAGHATLATKTNIHPGTAIP